MVGDYFMNYTQELTLLSEGQIWGNSKEKQLTVIKKYGIPTAITDLAILTGAYVSDKHIKEDASLSGRVSYYWTKTDDGSGDVCAASFLGNKLSKCR